jgi:RimJ/RimL family protein N-acetyltransferase
MSNNVENRSFLQLIKQMEEGDLKQVWLMRNDPEVVRFSDSNMPVSWEEFEAVYKYTNYPKLVFKTGSSNEIIGYVEFRNDMKDDDQNTKEWAFFIAEAHRGKGWSEIMLDLAIDWARNKGYTKLRGIVKKDNEASKYLHQKLGFEIQKENNNEITYIFNF